MLLLMFSGLYAQSFVHVTIPVAPSQATSLLKDLSLVQDEGQVTHIT